MEIFVEKINDFLEIVWIQMLNPDDSYWVEENYTTTNENPKDLFWDITLVRLVCLKLEWTKQELTKKRKETIQKFLDTKLIERGLIEEKPKSSKRR